MDKYNIIILNWNNEKCKTVKFIGDYRDARIKADKILYSNDNYWAYRIEHDW